MAAIQETRLFAFARARRAGFAILVAIYTILFVLLPAGFSGSVAYAEPNCDARESLIAKLNTGYAEEPVALGLASTGNVVELLISAQGSWTILVTRPNGIACVAAVGRNWQQVKRVLDGEQS